MSQSSKSELSQSIIAVIAVLGVVALIEAFVLSMMYNGIGENQMSATSVGTNEEIAARIKPVVTLDDIRGGDSAPAAAVPVVAQKSPADLYNGVCAACHATGAAGAPKVGDKAAWEPRFANGEDALFNSAKNGKGAMPPKGGSAYSDDEIKSVISYMLIQTGLKKQAAKMAAEPAPAKAEPMAETSPAPQASSGSDVDVAAGEKVYNSVCFACHASGVAGAPKLGNGADWSARKGHGITALTASVIHGKGAMPPKGGAGYLSDDDIKNTVGFMLSKI